MNCLLRYPGAKWASAEKIISYFPKHKGYLEPFFGSGGVLFSKEKSNLETINDIDGEVINFFNVLKSNYQALENMLKFTPYSKEFYLQIRETQPENEIDRAYKFFVISWMSHCGYQPFKSSWSHSNDPKGPNKAVIFKAAVDNLPAFAERLREVQIEKADALELIPMHDFKDTLIYLDPPYVLSTWKNHLYKNEMTDNEHLELLSIIKGLDNAKVLISGYDNELYNEQLAGWNKSFFDSTDGKGNIKQEVVWFNYELNNQLTLF